ncbi:MAG: MFS transporter [Anaerolineales bacterium]|nr:MFS transporter [Chloroflexota bacterium]MBL6982167.1 MFS transporter [Anaerolineales bacterium]
MNESIPAPKNMRSFVTIWLGQVISILGSGLTGFGLAVWIYDQTGQATPFALTALFSSLPQVLLSPIAGSFADRYNRRRIMILADTGAAVVTLMAALLIFSESLQIWHIYLIALFSAIFSAFQEPAYLASTTMLVPKKDLARSSGMMQMGQAISSILTPVIAGALYGFIGLKGIILIDAATYLFAIGALLMVHIPQPKVVTAKTKDEKKSIWKDAFFGWNYLRLRPGLFGLLLYFAMVNFFLNVSGVMMGPLILSFGTPTELGVVQTVFGVSMLIGSLIMSAWGGPQRRVRWLFGTIALAISGMLVTGLQANIWFIASGAFILMFFVPIASSLSQAIFQSKVAPGVQGRVFAIRRMISQSIMPIAYLISGPLADRVLNPLLVEGGALSNTFVGDILGVGPARGIGLMFVLSTLFGWAATLVAYANPRIRLVDDELPDALPDAPQDSPGDSELAEAVEPSFAD